MDAESGGSVPKDTGGQTNDALVDLQGLDFEFVASTENENIWCDQCKVLKQELQKLQQEHSLNYSTLKKKVISTDLLIKKYKAKCEDHDTQSKTMEDLTKKLEQVQRESSTLNVQLSSSLQQIEPLKKAKHALEIEVKQKMMEIQTLQDKLTASMAVRKQYESLAKSTSSEKDRTEEERKNNYKRLKELQASFNKQEQLVSKLKDKNKALKEEHAETVKKQRKLHQRLKVSLERFDKYWSILKEHDLIPKGEKRLKTATYLDSDESDVEDIEDDVSPPFVSCHAMLENDGTEKEGKDSDEESLLWTFSPIVHVLSPLPPSPAPPRQCDSPVDGASQSDDDQLAQQLEDELLLHHRKNFHKPTLKNKIKAKKDIGITKSVEGKLLRRQSATTIESESHLSEEEQLDKSLVPESKKLEGLKDNSNCSLSKEDDLVRTSDTAIHTSPEEEEIISPRRRRVSSQIVSDSDSDISDCLTKTDSCQKTSQDTLHTESSANRNLNRVQEQSKIRSKAGVRYSLRRSPRCEDMVPLGKRLTRSMSSPIKGSPKGSNTERRQSSRLSLCSEVDYSKTKENSTKLYVAHPNPNTQKGPSKTKLDLEKLKRDYKAMQYSHKIQNTVEDDVNSHLFTRSKSKTLLPTSGTKGRKNLPSVDSFDTETKPPLNIPLIENRKQNETILDISNSDVNRERKDDSELAGQQNHKERQMEDINQHNSELKGTDSQNSELKGTGSQNSELKGTDSQNSELKGNGSQNSELKGTDSQNSELNGTDSQNSELKGTGSQNSELKGTDSQNSELNGTDSQNSELKGTGSQNSELNGTGSQNSELKGTGSQNSELKGTDSKNSELKGTDSQNSELNGTGSKNNELKGERGQKCDSKDSIERLCNEIKGHSDLPQVICSLVKCDKTDVETEQKTDKTVTKEPNDKVLSRETESSKGKALQCTEQNSSLLGIPSADGEENYEELDESRRNTVSRQSSTGFILKTSPSTDSVTDQSLTPQSPGPMSPESLTHAEQTSNKHSSKFATSSLSKLSEGAENGDLRCNTEILEKEKVQTLNLAKQTNRVMSKCVEKRCENVENDSLVKDSYITKEDSVESCDHLFADDYLSQPSTSTDASSVYIPFSTQLHSSQSIQHNVTSSRVISPEISEDGSTMSGCVQMGHRSSSLAAASPVSPLPPSPIDFIIPLALSPLPPSPIPEQDPLSPLPGSPWQSDSTSLISSLTHMPSSDNSSDNTPVVTPVPSLLMNKSELTLPATSDPESQPTATCNPVKEKAGQALCSFHAEAPSGAIYVKPKTVSNKRSNDRNDLQHSKRKVSRTEVDQTTAKPRGEKMAATKRKSIDKLPCTVSQEKKLCISARADGPLTEKQQSQSSKRSQETQSSKRSQETQSSKRSQETQSSKRSQETQKINALVLNVIQMLMEQYLDSSEVSTSKTADSLLATDKDVAVVISTWIHWLVQHLLCSNVESFTLLKPVCEGGQNSNSDQCPFLADQEVKLLQLYSELQQKNLLDDLKQKLLDSLWSSLSLSNLLPVMAASALSRMYTGVCRLDGDVESVRVMVFQLLGSTRLPFHSLGVAIAGVWPLVLYKTKKDEYSMLAVIEQKVTRTLNTGKQEDEKMLECYYRLCNWCRVSLDSHALSKQLHSAMALETRETKPCQDKIFSLMRSLELLFMLEPIEFYLIHSGLNSVCQKCTNPKKVKTGDTLDQAFDPEYAKCVFRLLGCILPKKRDARQKNINQAVKNLQKVLKSEVHLDVKICVVETLLELCVLNPTVTLNILQDWYNSHRSQVPLSLRPKLVWTREIMLKKYPLLKCQPFS